MSEFEILKGVTVPTMLQMAGDGRRKYPFHLLEVGDMFFVPGREKNTLSTRCSSLGKRLNAKYKTRMLYMHRVNDAWVACTAKDDGATLGIGVWRVE